MILNVTRTVLAILWHAAFFAPFFILMLRACREDTDRKAAACIIAGWINFAIGWAFFESIPALARYWMRNFP